jgi:hypothetical protein
MNVQMRNAREWFQRLQRNCGICSGTSGNHAGNILLHCKNTDVATAMLDSAERAP